MNCQTHTKVFCNVSFLGVGWGCSPKPRSFWSLGLSFIYCLHLLGYAWRVRPTSMSQVTPRVHLHLRCFYGEFLITKGAQASLRNRRRSISSKYHSSRGATGGAKFPMRRITMGAPNHCGRRRMTAGGAEWLPGPPKSPNNVTNTFFNTVHLLPKTSGSNMGAPKLLLAPGARYAPASSLRPCIQVLHVFQRQLCWYEHLTTMLNAQELLIYLLVIPISMQYH